MKIALGNDHAGVGLREHVIAALHELGHTIIDRGTPDHSPVDFPDITRTTCKLVRTGQADRAVLLCGTGIGAVIAANKIPGIRAGLGHDVFSAHQGVEHDDTNTIAMGAWLIGPAIAREALTAFLNARFDDDEHTRRRVEKLHDMELAAAQELLADGDVTHRPR